MECFPSKLRLLGLFGLTCVMVGMCYLCTTLPDLVARVVGWIGVAFFGLGFVVIPVMFLRRDEAQVVINDEGIEDRRQKIGLIRWEDIRTLSIGTVSHTSFLCVELIDPGRYLSRQPNWTRPLRAVGEWLEVPPLTIGFAGLRPGLAEVWGHLQARFDTTSPRPVPGPTP